MDAEPWAEPRRMAALMAGFAAPWFIAGGWAIDLFLGRERRRHKDIDLAILRPDQLALQAHFAGWDLQKYVGPDGQEHLEPWSPGEWLEWPTFQVVLQRGADGYAELEVLFNEVEGDEWAWRVNTQIRRPLALIGRRSLAGLPFLSPELVLLFKSRHIHPDHRNNANDQIDFEETLLTLEAPGRAWLKSTLQAWYPGHPWLAALSDDG